MKESTTKTKGYDEMEKAKTTKKSINWSHVKTVIIAVLVSAIVFTIFGYFMSINITSDMQARMVQNAVAMSKQVK